MKITRVSTRRQFNFAAELFLEYMDELSADPGTKHLPVQKIEKDISHLATDFAPPKGVVWLAIQAGEVAGCVGMKTFRNRKCEMKRLYVRKRFRRAHIGKMLALACIQNARTNGYELVRLATTPSMTSAISL